jgi:hypothetical protein
MFQRSSRALEALLSLTDDVLGDPFDEEPLSPHIRSVRARPRRRGGSVPARPERCLCPVHAKCGPEIAPLRLQQASAGACPAPTCPGSRR